MRDKDALVEELREALGALEVFCTVAGVKLGAIEASQKALERLTRVGEAANALLAPEERCKAYLAQAWFAERLYSAIKPHKRGSEFAVRMATVSVLAERSREATAPEKADLRES